jgi:predicted O-methyltransferase YrrM
MRAPDVARRAGTGLVGRLGAPRVLAVSAVVLATGAAVLFGLDLDRPASVVAAVVALPLTALVWRLHGVVHAVARAVERGARPAQLAGGRVEPDGASPDAALAGIERRLVGSFSRAQREVRLTHALVGELDESVQQTAARVASLDERVASLGRRVASVEARVVDVVQSEAGLRAAIDGVGETVTSEAQATRFAVHTVPQDVEASIQLRELIAARTILPPTGGWAIDARTLFVIAQAVRRRKPRYVVELGSGASTVWLGHLVKEYGGRLLSIEGEEAYAEIVRDSIREHGLESTVDLHVAPLADVIVDGETWRWYGDVPGRTAAPIEFLLVDGPAKATGPLARYPALPVLRPHLAPDALIALDDARRPDEREIVRRWLATTPGLEQLTTSADDLSLLRLGTE